MPRPRVYQRETDEGDELDEKSEHNSARKHTSGPMGATREDAGWDRSCCEVGLGQACDLEGGRGLQSFLPKSLFEHPSVG